MHVARSIAILALLPLFAGCQMFSSQPATPSKAGLTRMQGELSAANGKLLFQPCRDTRRYVVNDTSGTSVLQETADLSDQPGKIFADLRGKLSAATAGTDGQVDLQQLYRLERSNTACDDPEFKRMILRASGHKPEWSLKASGKGMVLEREGQAALAVPYLEEQLGEGRFNLATEANGQHVELWAVPQRCVDNVTGSVQHMSAELRVNGQVQRGCASFGGSRDD